MANKSKTKKSIKPSSTLRQKAAEGPVQKRRVIRKTASNVGRSVRVLKPLAKPFRTKPLRIIGLILWPRFLRNAWKELRQTTWPNRKDTLKLTSAVFIFAIVFGLIIALADYGLDHLFKKILL